MPSKKRAKVRSKRPARQRKASRRSARPKRSLKVARRTVKRKAPTQRRPSRVMRRTARQSIKVPSPTIKEKEIGFISHYFTNIGVGILEVTQGKVKQGDRVHIKGETTDFIQKISSMQYEHEQVSQAEAGKSIGIKVSDRVRQHDKVYLVL